MKQLFIFTIFLLLSVTSFAQAFQGGVAAGIVGSQVAGDTYSGFNKAGAYAALWVRLGLSESSSLQTELSFFQKGSRHNPDDKRQDYTFYLMRLSYIEMPFLYQYTMKNKISLEVGPSLSFLLHSYEELDYMELSYGDFHLINLSLMAGFGYPINDRLTAHLRTDNSLVSMRKDEVSSAVHRIFDHGQYNDCIVLYLSYRF